MLAELAVGLALAAPPGARTVGCDEVIDTVRFPALGSAEYPSQQVLGSVSAPARHVPQSSGTGERPWTYFSKWGLVVRAGRGADVSVTVPPAWRDRVAISWGNNQHRVFHTLRLPRCDGDAGHGSAYAGGFFLRKPADCVPLRFRVGTRTRLVWFGIVRRCGPR
jgi:hypothetical protein